MLKSSNIRRQALAFFMFAFVMAVTVGLAHAQSATPAPPDYAALATTARNESVSAMSASAPVAFGLLAVFLGVGVAWRWIKKAAKSS